MRKRLTLQAIERAEEFVKNSTGERHSTVFGIVSAKGEHLHSIECIDGEWARTDKPVTILYIGIGGVLSERNFLSEI